MQHHNVVEAPECGTPAFHHAGKRATPTSALLLRSVQYGSLPVRFAGGGIPIVRTVDELDFNASLMESATLTMHVEPVCYGLSKGAWR